MPVNLSPLKEINKFKPLKEDFIFPDYKKYSISNIASSVSNLFGIKSEKNNLPEHVLPNNGEESVVLFLIDGLGFNQFQKNINQIKLFKKLEKKSEIFPLTSVFPSTTPAALTSIHTGLTPQEHGLPEWTVYFEEADKIIETLPFRPIFDPNRETMLGLGGYPEMLYEGNTIYLDLKKDGIKSFLFTNQEYHDSAYSKMSQNGAEVIGYSTYSDLITKLISNLESYKKPAYYFIYWTSIDSSQHAFGPNSNEHFLSMEYLSSILENEFFSKISPEVSKKIKFIMTADHGQSSIKGEDIIYLNNYLNLESSYLWGKSKRAIHPTGSPHDVFLHIFDPKIKEILDFLRTELKQKADILLIDEAIDMGLFGTGVPTEKFIKRIGDILILPHLGYHVWYKHIEGFEWKQKGIHGGLSEDEMLVPFISTNLSNLI